VHILLPLGDAFLAITADVIQALAPLIKFGLIVHGVIVYVGLATTAVVALGRAMVAGGISTFLSKTGASLGSAGADAEEAGGRFNKLGTAIGSLGGFIAAGLVNTVKYAGSVKDVGKAEGIAAAGSKVLGDGIGLIPFGPAGLAAGALAAGIGVLLYYALTHTSDAAAKFNKQMQALITDSDISNIAVHIQTALSQTTAKIQEFDAAYGRLVNNAQARGGGAWATKQLNEYQAGLAQVVQETGAYGSRMATLTTVFGSASAAQSALNLTGIQAGTIATETGAKWQQQLSELKGLAAGYGYMGQAAGAAGAQLNTLNIASGTTLKNVQALTQAESAWISLITGGDNAFTSFEQDQSTLNSAMTQGAASGATLRITVGKLSEKLPVLTTNLDGTTASALAARQAFDQQLGAATTLYGNLQTLATASGNTAKAQASLAKAGKDIIAQLLPFARGSREATAEVSALAQIMGGPATDNFMTLAKWVGNTKNAESDLNTQQAKLTISSANLTAAAKNLGNALQTSINNMESQAILKTSNLAAAVQGLANAQQSARGQVSTTAVTFAGEYVNALTRSGVSTANATQYLNAYLKQIGYSNAAITAIDDNLGDSSKQWQNYSNAMVNNAKAQKEAAKATAANAAAFSGLGRVLPGSVQQLEDVWGALVKEDGALVTSGNHASAAKTQFVNFAHDGLDVSKNSAQELWAKFGQQNLDVLASKAGATKTSFIQFAENGLHLTALQAQTLWGEFALQNLDMLMQKGDSAKGKFIQFAKNGLDLTTSAAITLWNTLRQQYLDTVASKAGETERAFEKTATQLGLTKQAADQLWTSLHKIAAGSPYKASLSENISGTGGITATSTIPGAGGTKLNARLVFQGMGVAAGGIIPGGVHGRDSVPALLAPGELVVPASHAPAFGAMAKRAGIPGMAAGGIAGTNDQMLPWTGQQNASFSTAATSAFAKALISAVKTQAAAAAAAGGAYSGNGSLLSIARWFMSNGANAAAAAGIASVIDGESGGNPEALEGGGGGGWGLIQWTGNTQGLPAGYTHPTGNYNYDMSMQLKGALGYINGRGGLGRINAAGNPIGAADVFSAMEAPLVPLSDTRPAVANALYAQLLGGKASSSGSAVSLSQSGGLKAHSGGGVINEPVLGFGVNSGIPYSFAENGQPEFVSNLSQARANAGSGGMPGATTYQAATQIQLLQQAVKLLQQLPYAQARATNQAGSSGVKHGYYGAQN
jgi:hypothetical protein